MNEFVGPTGSIYTLYMTQPIFLLEVIMYFSQCTVESKMKINPLYMFLTVHYIIQQKIINVEDKNNKIKFEV